MSVKGRVWVCFEIPNVKKGGAECIDGKRNPKSPISGQHGRRVRGLNLTLLCELRKPFV